MNVAAELPIVCPVCGEEFYGPGAEELAFNSQGACPTCDGIGQTQVVDESTLVPDESLTIDEGAVAPWNSLMWSLMGFRLWGRTESDRLKRLSSSSSSNHISTLF